METVPGNVTQSKVTKLTPLKEYKFRVRAVNQEGEGPNAETEQKVLAKNPFDEPGKPGVPEISDWDKVTKTNSLTLLYSYFILAITFARIESTSNGSPLLTMAVHPLRNI